MNPFPAGFDFRKSAEREMIKEGFRPFFPAEVLAQPNATAAPPASGQDLRGLLWSSIDNSDSLDLDQVEWVEKLPGGTIRVLVGIADVDVGMGRDSSVDQHARANATSVYTGGPVFPMLPDKLSHNLTSLCESGDRLAIVVEFEVPCDGNIQNIKVYEATIRNKARMSYDRVARFLKGQVASPLENANAAVDGLVEQLQLQHEVSDRLIEFRKQRGALVFGGAEQVPIVVNNHVHGIETVDHNGARDIIESLMIAANVAIARYLRERSAISIRRVVRKPKRWDRIQSLAAAFGVHLPDQPEARALGEFLAQRKKIDPLHFPELSLGILKSMGPGEYVVERPGQEREGHFGLAVNDYSHSTAPNRRYADLVMQRLLKACLKGNPIPYTESGLAELAAHCTERESAARHVERFMKKVAAALMLSSRVGDRFVAIVAGVAEKGTFVRLLDAPAEGRLIRGERGLDVGDKINVRLIGVDVERGFVDFEAMN